jgi:hypothetical protein
MAITPADDALTERTLSAYDYLKALQASAGPRLSGTEGEVKAVTWLQHHLQAAGLTPVTQPFTYPADTRSGRLRSIGLAYSMVALTLLSRSASPWLILLGIVAAFVIFGPIWRRLQRSAGTVDGRNVLAGVTRHLDDILEHPRQKLIFLCAHYDTGPSLPAWRQRLGRLNDAAAGLAFLGVLALTAFSLVFGILSLLPTAGGLTSGLWSFWQAAGAWLVLAAGLPGTVLVTLSALTHRAPVDAPVNPGADDNGSGVATVLDLAGALQHDSPTDIDVIAAFWAAEEAGLWGSEAFVEQNKERLDPAGTTIINIDTVGRGASLMAVSGEGMLRRRRVDEGLLQKWEQACRQVGATTIREWLTPLSGSSDHAAWLNAGFNRALSIGRGDVVAIALPIRLLNRLLAVPAGTHQTDISHVHSPADNIDGIRPESLAETIRAVRTLVSLLT